MAFVESFFSVFFFNNNNNIHSFFHANLHNIALCQFFGWHVYVKGWRTTCLALTIWQVLLRPIPETHPINSLIIARKPVNKFVALFTKGSPFSDTSNGKMFSCNIPINSGVWTDTDTYPKSLTQNLFLGQRNYPHTTETDWGYPLQLEFHLAQ